MPNITKTQMPELTIKHQRTSVAPNGSSRGTDYYTETVEREDWLSGQYAGMSYRITRVYLSTAPDMRGQQINKHSEPWV